MTLSGAILIINMLVLARLCQELAPGARYAPLLVPVLAGFYFPLVFWSLRGMEVGLLVLLIDAALLQAVRLRRGFGSGSLMLGLLLAGALVVRVDAAFAVALILLFAATSPGLKSRQVWPLLLAVLAILLIILAWQAAYFGSALPNTYYQKMVGGSLMDRLRSGVLAFFRFAARDLLLLALLSAVGLTAYPSLRTREALLLAGLFVAQCMYSVWVGGDYAEPEVSAANRFITQGMPALFVLFGLVIDRALSGRLDPFRHFATIVAAAVAVATLFLVSGPPWLRWLENGPPLWKADVRRARAGFAIASSTSLDVTIAVHAAGQIPYYSQRRAIDLLGLNDEVIARGPRSTSFYPGHDKWNYEYSIGELHPDLIADNWIRLADYMRNRPDYLKLTNGMYMRVDTMLVDEPALLRAYP